MIDLFKIAAEVLQLILIAALILAVISAVKWRLTAMALTHIMVTRAEEPTDYELRRSMEYVLKRSLKL